MNENEYHGIGQKTDDMQLSPNNGDKLTNWSNEPTIVDLKGDLERSREVQSAQMSKINEWNDLTKIEGKAKPKKRRGRSSYQPMTIRRQNEWRYSALTEPFHSSEDLIKVEPVTWEDEESAKQNSLLINWQWRTKMDRIKFIDDVVRSTVDEGTCIVKVGWKRFTQVEDTEVPIYDMFHITEEEDFLALQQAIALEQENPKEYERDVEDSLKEAVNYYKETGVPAKAVQSGTEMRPVEKVIDNYPTVEVMDLNNVYIDPTCRTNLEDALFIINAYEVNKADLVKNKELYKNTELINWQSDSDSSNDFFSDNLFRNFNDSTRRKKVAYDYWGYYDINGDGILKPILATWVDNIMIRMVENPFPDGKPPFVIMNYMPVKRKLYGEPDAELLKDNQQLHGALYRSVIDIVARSANAQTAVVKGVLDGVNRVRFENEENFEVNNINGLPNGGIIPIVTPEIPVSLFNFLGMNNDEIESITGVKSFSGGLSGDAYGKVATNTRGVLDAASKREMAILRRIAGGIKNVSYKIIAMNGAFLSKEETVRLTNGEFVPITQESLKGNFDLKVDISTAEIDEARSNDLGFLLQTIGNTVDQSLTQVVLAEIIELKKMPKLAHMVRSFQRQPSPEEQEMMAIDMELKRKQLEMINAEIELTNAKAMEAMSKANQNEIDNNKTLDGSTHRESIEKTQAQAEANRLLEADKAQYAKEAKEAERGQKPTEPLIAPIEVPTSMADRDRYSAENPILNLGSSKFDPKKDPALNPAMNL